MTLIHTVRSLQRGAYATGNPDVVERSTDVYVYEIDNDDELIKFKFMTREELFDELGLYEDPNPGPGEIYHRYEVTISLDCLIVIDQVAYNM